MALPPDVRALPSGDLHVIAKAVEEFVNVAWPHVRKQLAAKASMHETTLRNKTAPIDDIRYTQGALDGIACAIMLVEGFTDDARKELRRR